MSKRVDKIRKKLELRRKEIKGKTNQRERSAPVVFDRHDEARDEPDFYLYQDGKKQEQEQWLDKDRFLLKTMVAVVLFLLVAIMFKTPTPQLEGARNFVKHSFEQEFQFAAVADWYEGQFGRPLALLPNSMNVALDDVDQEHNPEIVFAVPASGTITESFQQNGTGILVETGIDENVEAVKAGFVFSVKDEDSLGKTVGIEHHDGSESWYGMLEKVDVKLHDHVEAGKPIGKVSSSNSAGKGVYYFALKQGETYIDPIDVISFD
ncbi:M23 family metallopeptidase [Bacillus sp. FJAT-45350]|uniref:M23 family metallopeptidase n=1 Tax=Bacillus sp. FJAT-45350 TaxID=2011014 RepID=UPI000BB72460|nr:M23 family metallopeptidase [Bacillus sp. FJAT-45350]